MDPGQGTTLPAGAASAVRAFFTDRGTAGRPARTVTGSLTPWAGWPCQLPSNIQKSKNVGKILHHYVLYTVDRGL